MKKLLKKLQQFSEIPNLLGILMGFLISGGVSLISRSFVARIGLNQIKYDPLAFVVFSLILYFGVRYERIGIETGYILGVIFISFVNLLLLFGII